MKCTNCGADVANTDSFCQNCGAQLNRGNYMNSGPYDYQGQNKRSGGSSMLLPIILLAAAAVIAAAAVGWYLFSHRTPEVEALSYDELITEYSLYSDDSDRIKNAYYDNVRIDFEEVSRKQSGYKATAVIYSPDMEDIYGKTTEESSVVNALERLSEGDLKMSRKTVLLEKGDGSLTHNSAEQLQDEVDKKFMTVDEYTAIAAASGNSSNTSGNSSNAGSSSSGSDSAPSASASIQITNTPSQANPTPSAPSAPTPQPSHSSSSGGYMISDSSSRVISSSELSGFSAWQCRIARNEIYARHGRKFKDSSLQNYFNGCSWYIPTVEADSFNEGVLNSCEKTNIQTIRSYEKAHGYL